MNIDGKYMWVKVRLNFLEMILLFKKCKDTRFSYAPAEDRMRMKRVFL